MCFLLFSLNRTFQVLEVLTQRRPCFFEIVSVAAGNVLQRFFFWWGGESQSLQNRGCWLKMRCSGPSLQFDHWQWSSVFPSGKQTFSMFMCSSWIWLKTFSRYSTIHFWILNYTINIYWIPVFFYFLRVYTTLLLKSILFSESGPF